MPKGIHDNHARGERNGNSVLNVEQVRRILTSDDTAPFLAKEFGCGATTVRQVRRGDTWSWIKEGTCDTLEF
jgi:hypothetical protein